MDGIASARMYSIGEAVGSLPLSKTFHIIPYSSLPLFEAVKAVYEGLSVG